MKLQGDLQFSHPGVGEIKNAVIERVATLPPVGTPGRLVYNTSTNQYYYDTGAIWTSFATGGNAAMLQSEVDAIEASLGTLVNSDGSFNANAFTGFANVSAPTSTLNALKQLDGAITGKDALAELVDVGITAPATSQLLQFNGTKWNNVAIGSASGVQSHGLVLDAIKDLAATDGQIFKHVAGAWSVQTDTLANKNDVALTSAQDGQLLSYNGTSSKWVNVNIADIADGHLKLGQLADVTDASGYATGSAYTLVGTGSGYTVASLALDTLNDVVLSSAAAGDVLYRNAGGNWVNGPTGAASGVQKFSADLSDIAALTPTANDVLVYTSGHWKNSAPTATRSAIGVYSTAETDAKYVKLAGDTMQGNMIVPTGFFISVADVPLTDSQVTNKAYVDAAVAGLTWKSAVVAATDTDITLSGVQVIDGVSVVAGDRVLVKSQTVPAQNGIYVVGTGAWTRSTDFDKTTEINGAGVWVEEGTKYGNTGWTQVLQVATLGTSDIQFVQFNGASGITAGVGLSKDGNTLNVNLGAGISELPTDEVGIDLYDTNTGALILTTDGATHSTNTNSKLYLKLDGSTLVQTASGLKVAEASITPAQLNVAVAGAGLVGGAGTALAVNVDDVTLQITAGDSVSVKDGGIANAKLVNSSFSVLPGTSAADAVALGETLKFVAGTSGAVVITGTGSNDVVIESKLATTSQVGVAKFDVNHFTVDDAGKVATNVSLGQLKNVDDAIDTAATGTVVTKVGSSFVARPLYFLFDGSASPAASEFTVTHGLGVQFVNVTVYDETNEVVIPQSIQATSATVTTVTFNSNIQPKIVIMGVAS